MVDEREDELPVELAEAFLVACLRYEQQEQQLPAVSNVADSSASSANSSLSALAASTLDQPDSLRIDIAIVSAAGLAKGSSIPNRDKVGKVTRDQVLEIVNTKKEDLNANSDDAACRIIEGTARSMGIEII